MIEEIRLMLGDAAPNYTDAQIKLALKFAMAEIEDYCKREIDDRLELTAQQMAVVKLNRIGTQGLTSQSFSGVSEAYSLDYPDDIMRVLNSKRKVKVL